MLLSNLQDDLYTQIKETGKSVKTAETKMKLGIKTSLY